MEKDLPAALQAKYDRVLGTTVVHAASYITRSCEQIRLMLRKDGFVMLLELTRTINWFDLIFRLLS